ncbi:MAG: HK97 family phage prohead protease [Propylenella sp.]
MTRSLLISPTPAGRAPGAAGARPLRLRRGESPTGTLSLRGRGWALARETKFAHAELSEVEADGSFSGYASLFGETDLNRDVVAPGAFQKSIRERGAAGIRMLFQHDPALPIGVWKDIREDSRGLYVRGRLMPEVAKAREVLALMRAGAIDGLSIGFRTVRGRTDAKSGVRRLIEVDLWEISVVTFPMLPAARVSAVKGARGTALLVGAIRRAARKMRALSLPLVGRGGEGSLRSTLR